MRGRRYKMPKENSIRLCVWVIDFFVYYVLRFRHGPAFVQELGRLQGKKQKQSSHPSKRRQTRRMQTGPLQRRIMSTLQKIRIMGRDSLG